MEYSVWGCNGPSGGCKDQADWALLSDPVSYTFPTAGKPEYVFNGLSSATEIFRSGSTEFGTLNAYVQHFTFATGYNFFAIRGSTIAMKADTADPELDAMAAFNRVDVPLDVPEPATLSLFGLAALGLITVRRRRKGSA